MSGAVETNRSREVAAATSRDRLRLSGRYARAVERVAAQILIGHADLSPALAIAVAALEELEPTLADEAQVRLLDADLGRHTARLDDRTAVVLGLLAFR